MKKVSYALYYTDLFGKDTNNMLQLQQKEACCGCHACSQICPKHCITMHEDEEGFRYPGINKSECIACGLCEKVCPILKTVSEEAPPEPQALAACSSGEDIRLASSSGGIFTLLAQQILAQEGTVYGAAMTSVTEANHIRVCQPQQLQLLRGSKYIQSNIGTCYIQAREDLQSGKTVLFSGTPCQIEGLRSFLGKDYSRLFCVDIICHGVPSPMVWRKYVQHREKQAGSHAVRVNFRHKRYGWREYSLVLGFANGKTYSTSFAQDPYMRAYLHDLCLRPSCYQCRFKKCSRVSDITLADFWGIERVSPQMDDNKGTSLVILHTQKAHQLMQQISDQMRYEEVALTSALRQNPSMVTAANRPDSRDSFLRDIQTQRFPKAVDRYVKRHRTLKGFARSAVRKLGLKKVIDNSPL